MTRQPARPGTPGSPGVSLPPGHLASASLLAGEPGAPGRHNPSGRITDVTGGNGGPARHQCGGCEAPIAFQRGEWRSAYTQSMWCRAGAR
jgi:hypothetical protein